MLHGQQTLVLTVESVNEALADYINKHLAGVRVDELNYGTSYNTLAPTPITVHVTMKEPPLARLPQFTFTGLAPLFGENAGGFTEESRPPRATTCGPSESMQSSAQVAVADGYSQTTVPQPAPMSNSSLRGDTLYATPTGPKVLLHLEDNP